MLNYTVGESVDNVGYFYVGFLSKCITLFHVLDQFKMARNSFH